MTGLACAVPETPPSVWVTIPEGAPLEAVAESLAVHDVIRSAGAFRRYARMGRKHERIRPGTYSLRVGTPMGRVLPVLFEGRPFRKCVVIRAGMRLLDVGALLERTLGVPIDSFMVGVTDAALRDRVGARGPTLEGYLLPGAYYVPLGGDVREVLAAVLDGFERHWSSAWDAQLDSLGLTRDEIVTLASIIEGEGPLDEDRRLISSVYHNRLAQGMRLQADPTVVYALGEQRRLYYRDYRVDSPYNTYRVGGLPPSPIGQPSLSSIEAALYPAQSDFLYFVASRGGHHVFSRTYDEHLTSIREARD